MIGQTDQANFQVNLNWNKIDLNNHIKHVERLFARTIRVVMWSVITTSMKSVLIFKNSVKQNQNQEMVSKEFQYFMDFFFSLKLFIYDSLESYLERMLSRRRMYLITFFQLISWLTTIKAFILSINSSSKFFIKILGDYTYSVHPRHDITSLVMFLGIFAVTFFGKFISTKLQYNTL